MALAADKAAFEAPIRRTILIAALAGGAATLLAMLLAIWAARRIAAPIEQIEQGTHALLRREPIAFAKTGVAEVDRALDAFVATAGTLEQHEKERDEREAHVRLIMRELSHRSKNLLAIVLAIARQTSRTTNNFEEFEERFNARIQALADAHDLLVEQQWVGAALDDLVRAQLSAFGMERVSTSGDKVMLRAEAVQNVALALHELATNAVEIRRAVGARRPGRDRMDAARRRRRRPPDLARDRRAAGDRAGAQGLRPLRAGARHRQRARLGRHRVLAERPGLDLRHQRRAPGSPPGKAAPKEGADAKRRLAS